MPRSLPTLRSAAGWIPPHLLAIAAALACVALPASTPLPADPVAAAFDAAPGIAPRVSASSTFRGCVERAPDHGTVVRADCPPAGPGGTRRLARIAADAATGADPEALHTLALAEMVLPDDRGRALERAVDGLRRAAVLSDRPAPVHADLAAALIVRAERTQAPRDLLEAYEAAQQALAAEPRHPVARYNAALALERFGLVDETVRAWEAYLQVDAESEWAGDARRRIRALRSLAPPPAPRDDAALSAYAAYAVEDAQGARELGMERLLGEWGDAVEAGDSARAADRLERAAALGSALVRRRGGDAGLADMVRAIRGIEATPEIRRLARAHSAYAAGISLYRDGDYGPAEPRISRAAHAASAAPVLRSWSHSFRGTLRILNGNATTGERDLRTVIASADADRHPALAARARWALATTLSRSNRDEAALEQAHRSSAGFRRAGEQVNAAAAYTVEMDARFTLGEPDAGYALLHRAVSGLARHRGAVRLHTILLVAARIAASDGFARAAIPIQDEGVRVAHRTGRTLDIVEARLARARLLAPTDPERARIDVNAARRLLPLLEGEGKQAWFAADLQEAAALASVASRPGEAASQLDSVLDYFRSNSPRAFRTLVWGARARAGTGDWEGAATRLDSAMRVLEQRRAATRLPSRRAAIFEVARHVVDRLVLIRLARGDVYGARVELERARIALAPGGRAGSEIENAVLQDGESALHYSRIADTLLIWVTRNDDLRHTRLRIDTVRLARLTEQVHAQMERGADELAVRPALATLYESLIRPVGRWLGPPGTSLIVTAEDEIAALPFAALYDTAGGRYLIEDHPIRHSGTVRQEARRRSAATGGVLLVADPAFSPQSYPLLDRLPHARTEVERVSDLRPGAALLEGPYATALAFKEALVRSAVVHFAGHAVFDNARPELSYLLVSGRAGTERLTAAALSELDLRNVDLIVLSACRSARSGRGRGAGFTGLAGTLLTAGAGGVVGSLWQVDDHRTAEFMVSFHRHHARDSDASLALRRAQLSMVRSIDPRYRSPAVWAGFRYVTG